MDKSLRGKFAGSVGAGPSSAGGQAGPSGRGGGAGRGRGGAAGRGRGGAAAKAAEADDVDIASFKGLFNKDLRIMMFGFGDDMNPLDETVDLVEDIVLEYLTEVTLRAAAVSSDTLKPKMDEKDLLFIMRKDPAKFSRMKELLAMRQTLKEARQAFEGDVLPEGESGAVGAGAGAAAP
ncbi:hypothetical protein FOA52_004198 [Chlamydomonas sp. UWO 241]|nr:hypothetical protein FOA52_004198 [Chlamydomonas sp. UWO 241]